MIELIHPEKSNVSKSDIKAKLAQTLKAKEENISIFGLKTKFGGGRSTGFALLYDSLDARKKYDSKKMLRRVSQRLPSLRTFLAALSGLRRTMIDNKSLGYYLTILYRTATS